MMRNIAVICATREEFFEWARLKPDLIAGVAYSKGIAEGRTWRAIRITDPARQRGLTIHEIVLLPGYQHDKNWGDNLYHATLQMPR
jgi:hypothetical protein